MLQYGRWIIRFEPEGFLTVRHEKENIEVMFSDKSCGWVQLKTEKGIKEIHYSDVSNPVDELMYIKHREQIHGSTGKAN